MAVELAGARAYVTGGAQGIGRATATLLAESGATVAVSDVSEPALTSLEQEGLRIHCIPSDLSSPGGVAAALDAVEEWSGGSIDLLVNNVGYGGSNDFTSATDDSWEASFQLNLMSHVRTLRRLLPHMPPGGAVVNVASDLAKQPEAVPVEYGAMKAALLHVSKNLALTHSRIRVNAVLPGPVWTPLWAAPGGLVDQLAESWGVDRDEAVARYLRERHLPTGIADASDVAALIVFLLSPSARRITGAAVDLGGTTRSIL